MVQEAVAKRDTRFWIVAAFFYGLGLANHWPLLILGSPIFIAYIFASGKEFWGKLHYMVLSALIPAVLLYGWMVWRSHQDMPISFLGSINSLSNMIAFISREGFSDADSSASAGLIDKVYYARYFITEWFLQLSLLGGLFALWGIIHTYRKGWRFGLYGEVATVFTSSLLLIWMLGFDYEYLQVAVFRPYPLVAYCILALWFGLGINIMMQVAGRWRKLSLPIIVASFSLIIVAMFIYNGRTNYRADDRFAEKYAQALFDIVEHNAILVTHGDAYSMTTLYYHLVEDRRPDIRLLEAKGFAQNDRIVQPSWSEKQKSTTWIEFSKHTDRPFYHQSMLKALSPHMGHSSFGIAIKTNISVAPRSITIEKSDPAKQFFKEMIDLIETKDRWTIHHRNKAILTYGLYLGYVVAYNNSVMNNYIKDILPLAENNYWSLIGMTNILLNPSNLNVSIAEKYFKKAKLLGDDQRSKSDKALEFYLEGLIAKKRGNSHKAKNLFRKSIKVSSRKSNRAYKALKEL